MIRAGTGQADRHPRDLNRFHAQELRQVWRIALPASSRLCFDSVQVVKLRSTTFRRPGIPSCRVRTLVYSCVWRRRFFGGAGCASMGVRRAGMAARRIASGQRRVDRLGRWYFPRNGYVSGRFESSLAGRTDGERKCALGKSFARSFLDRAFSRYSADIREHRRNSEIQSQVRRCNPGTGHRSLREALETAGLVLSC